MENAFNPREPCINILRSAVSAFMEDQEGQRSGFKKMRKRTGLAMKDATEGEMIQVLERALKRFLLSMVGNPKRNLK
jgi:hypothetical protein